MDCLLPPQPVDDPLDAALARYARHFEQAEPSPGLFAAIMSEVQALHRSQSCLPPAGLREFLHAVAADHALRDQLKNSADRSSFVRALIQAGELRGFCFLKGVQRNAVPGWARLAGIVHRALFKQRVRRNPRHLYDWANLHRSV